MPKRFLMQKSHKYKDTPIGGFYASEKLDGMRVMWDGGMSRGIPKADVPFANHAKDDRYKEVQIATGLWTQLGNVVHAPDWFLDGLPKGTILGGELFKGYGFRQELMSAVKKLKPIDSQWKGIMIHSYELPHPAVIFADAKISTPTCKIEFTMSEVVEFNYVTAPDGAHNYDWNDKPIPFSVEQKKLQRVCSCCEFVVAHPQERLPLHGAKARERVNEMLDVVMSNDGEGIVLRDPYSVWEPHRSKNILKIKPTDDAEGIVVGYITGRLTDKGSKLLGKMGALILDYNGKRLELSGFTHAERALADTSLTACENMPAYEWATNNPESEVPDWIEAVLYPRGTVVSFKHRGFTKAGIPEEARYWRKRLDD